MSDEVTQVVVRAFVRHEGSVLRCRTEHGRDGLVVGPFSAHPEPAAIRQSVSAATGIDQGALAVVRTAGPFDLKAELQTTVMDTKTDRQQTADDQSSKRSEVFVEQSALLVALMDADERTGGNPSIDDTEWAPPTTLLGHEAAPEAWEHYRRVGPTVRSITADSDHGAATLSLRALELLRDRAAVVAEEGETDTAELIDLARRLRRARPSMAVLRNRLARAVTGGETPAELRAAATEAIERAIAADQETAFRAAGRIEGKTVATHSRSSTLLDALGTGAASAVYISESAPGREGLDTAADLAEDVPVTVYADAATAHVLASEPVDVVLVGADTVLPDGRVVNKAGTRGLALAATTAGIPVYVAAATDKISPEATVNIETGDAKAIYDGDASVDVLNPTFDVTPADAVDGIITERGTLTTTAVSEVATELASVIDDADI